MRGRKPKPTALHDLHGTTNATRHADRAHEPVPDGELEAGTTAPDWFDADQAAAWDYSLAHAPRGVLRRIDRGVLTVWVEAEVRHRRATERQAIMDRGNSLPLLTKGKNGEAVASPYVAIITKAALVMLKAASELGFSPAARPRLAARPAEQAEDGSAFARLRVIHGGRD